MSALVPTPCGQLAHSRYVTSPSGLRGADNGMSSTARARGQAYRAAALAGLGECGVSASRQPERVTVPNIHRPGR